MKNIIAILAAAIALPIGASADVVVTKDGSTLKGTILGIEGDSLTLSTAYAGELKIAKANIEQFSSDGDIAVSFSTGNAYVGKVTGGANGSLSIATPDGQLSTSMSQVAEGWQPGQQSPEQKRAAAELEKLRRKWSYEAAFDMTGKNGNSEALGIGTQFRATLKGPEDKLEFYAKYNSTETDNVKSADDARGGMDYSNNITDKMSWYVKSEVGRDAIQDVELFMTAAAGFGYTPVSLDTRTLTFRGGLSYRFESYDLTPDLSSAGVEFSLFHDEKFDWGKIVNRLTYNPIFKDFGNFRLVHDTAIELPLKSQGWKLRIGVANDYNSEPQPGKEELDTTYYTRLVLQWD